MSDELIMVRESLDHLPDCPLPPGFTVHWHEPGDEEIWVDLQAPFYDPGAITPALFRELFGSDEALLR